MIVTIILRDFDVSTQVFCPICGAPFERFESYEPEGDDWRPTAGHTCNPKDLQWERAVRDFVGLLDQEA